MVGSFGNATHNRVLELLNKKENVLKNISRSDLIREAVENKECLVSENGALVSWGDAKSTGRNPKDTFIVKRSGSQEYIDWDSPSNLPVPESIFEMVLQDVLDLLSKKEKLYVNDRVIGADSSYSLPVQVITNAGLTSVFVDNMFRAIPDDINKSIYAEKPFCLIALPYDKLDVEKYHEFISKHNISLNLTNRIVLMDMDNRIGIVIGTTYLGSVKKLMFTVMNYYLTFENILPLHCSANEGDDGKTALLLGLSGTGKTTLSADSKRALLGDDEHGWNDRGVANFENGCYAKMINMNVENEPHIYNAVLHNDNYLNHGAIIENALMYPNGKFDFYDDRLTQNSRSSYPLSFLDNIKKTSLGGHPSTILFLTADAYGVLPPVSKLDKDRAMLWFLMGYTSKLAGTETGVVEPQSTFSRFFGAPFMPCHPGVYAKMLGEKMAKHQTKVYLINTGWIGGRYGVGKRISLKYTRSIVDATLNGELESVEYTSDKLFHLEVPNTCSNVPSEILWPENTWKDKNAYKLTAIELAKQFSDYFDNAYSNSNIATEVKNNCPGK